MQQLPNANRLLGDVDHCAAEVVNVGLAVSRMVRAELRRELPGGLTLPQLRALGFINADPACAPSQLAESLMLSRPAVTRLLEGLVQKHLITRRPHPMDRRRIQLALTKTGRDRLESYFARARAIVAQRLTALPYADRERVTEAMALVLPLVTGAAGEE